MNKAISRPSLVGIALCGSALLGLYPLGLGFRGVAGIRWFLFVAATQCAVFCVAIAATRKSATSRSSFVLVVVFACLFRLSLVFTTPNLSDDVYRYIWDGRVQAAGINPYRHVPSDPALAQLRDDAIYPHINRRDYAPTIYPPVAQIVFLATSRISESVTWMKMTMLFFEAIAMFAIVLLLDACSLPRERLIVYAWHPLIVWEIAGNGHLDAIMMAFIALAMLALVRKKDATSGVALAFATLVKFLPVVMFPAFWRRYGWKLPAAFILTVVLLYSPYLSVGPTRVFGFLSGYTAEEGIDSGQRFFILSGARWLIGSNIPGAVYKGFALIVLGIVAVAILARRGESDREIPARLLLLATVFTVLLSPHYAWYFTWLMPMMCFISTRWLVPMLALTTMSFALYLTWLGDHPTRMLAINATIYLSFGALVLASFWFSSGRERVS